MKKNWSPEAWLQKIADSPADDATIYVNREEGVTQGSDSGNPAVCWQQSIICEVLS